MIKHELTATRPLAAMVVRGAGQRIQLQVFPDQILDFKCNAWVACCTHTAMLLHRASTGGAPAAA